MGTGSGRAERSGEQPKKLTEPAVAMYLRDP